MFEYFCIPNFQVKKWDHAGRKTREIKSNLSTPKTECRTRTLYGQSNQVFNCLDVPTFRSIKFPWIFTYRSRIGTGEPRFCRWWPTINGAPSIAIGDAFREYWISFLLDRLKNEECRVVRVLFHEMNRDDYRSSSSQITNVKQGREKGFWRSWFISRRYFPQVSVFLNSRFLRVLAAGVIRFPGESVGSKSEYSHRQNSLWVVVEDLREIHNANCFALS